MRIVSIAVSFAVLSFLFTYRSGVVSAVQDRNGRIRLPQALFHIDDTLVAASLPQELGIFQIHLKFAIHQNIHILHCR